MQEIIDTVGCGKNLLYREFPSKTDLVKAYLDRARADWEQRAAEASRAAEQNAAAQLAALVQAMADQVHDSAYRGCPFRNYLAEFSDPDDPGGSVASEYLRDTRARVDALVSQLSSSDPDLVAERIWLIIEGLYSAVAHPGGARTVDAAVSFVKEIVHGVA
jgi:AcrR family transcriptional regulator